MKIIQKPKIPEQTCEKCGCVVQIKTRDLIPYFGEEKDHFKCPICFRKNEVNFKGNESTEAAEE